MEPSPGASKSPERNTSSSSEIQRNVRRAVEIIDESEASDTEEEISATTAASKEGADCTHWSEVMKRRRERKPAPTYFVNTLSHLAGRPVRGPRPFPEGFPEGQVWYLRTEIGVPGYRLPAYETLPEGRILHRGHPAGTILGPVLTLLPFKRNEHHKERDIWYEREFVAAVIPFASDYDDDVCFVNIWTSHNNEARRKGMKYCTFVP